MYEGWMVGVFLLKRLCVTRVRNFLYDVRYEIMVFGFFVLVFRWGLIYSF